MLGVGSDDKPLLQHRREAVPVEVNPALDPDRRAKRRRLHRPVGQERQDPLDDRVFSSSSRKNARCAPRIAPRFASNLTAGGYNLRQLQTLVNAAASSMPPYQNCTYFRETGRAVSMKPPMPRQVLQLPQ